MFLTFSIVSRFSILVGVCCICQGYSQLIDEDDLTRHKYACASPPSCGTYMYSMECAVGQKIALRGLYYGAKPYTAACPDDTQSCVSKTTCCIHQTGDCLIPFSTEELYKVYKLCSRQLQCGWLFASSIDLKSTCPFRKKSNYIKADFQCIDDKYFIDICSQASTTGQTVHLHHNGLISSSYNYPQCSCVITPANCNNTATLRFKAVDIRLHSNDSLSDCSSQSRIELIGQNERKVVECDTGQFQYGFEDFHISQENGMVLYLFKRTREFPAKVWLQVETSQPGVDVTVTCGPRSVQTAKRCPALPIIRPGDVDKVEEVPPRGENTPSVIVIDGPAQPDGSDVDIEPESKGDNPAIWAIIGGIIAGVVVLILLLVLVCFILRRKKKSRKRSPDGNGKTFPYSDEAVHQVNYYESINPDETLQKSATGPRIYHQPWGNEAGISLNRKKPTDLAYATSEEIKVLIEKMERDRHFLNEGEEEHFQEPDPTFYRHIGNYTYKPNEVETPELSENENAVEADSETESKSLMSENCGTEKLESEDSKVEADRAIDSDVESPKPESETVSAYFDGYESPRVSSFQPSDTSSQRNSVRSSVRSDVQSDVGYSKFSQSEDVIPEDSQSDLDVPLEQAPVPNIEQTGNIIGSDGDFNSGVSSFKPKPERRKFGEITLGSYRQPKGSVNSEEGVGVKGSEKDLDENTGHYYTAVYDKIFDDQTKL